ncbi:MAG TPA: translesion DNA synthesis-associated protein ImuA [Rhodanobacteraceae bacterium]|jgi:cell division inhibitor SulA|nr:translesion DNA synthesis-associated protein ImuA [Rhodanobacteraceae bacterium]
MAVLSLAFSNQIWQGRIAPVAAPAQPTGWAELDAALPAGGWPDAALTEILLPADGVGELQLLMPTLARLTQADRPVLLIAPPYAPCVAGWRARGVDMGKVEIVAADEPRVLWAMEQALRAGCCSAVLGWPRQMDERQLRRLQVAADSGRALAFVFRDRKHAAQASPAALRIEVETRPAQLRVRKCRGGPVPAQPIAFGME